MDFMKLKQSSSKTYNGLVNLPINKSSLEKAEEVLILDLKNKVLREWKSQQREKSACFSLRMVALLTIRDLCGALSQSRRALYLTADCKSLPEGVEDWQHDSGGYRIGSNRINKVEQKADRKPSKASSFDSDAANHINNHSHYIHRRANCNYQYQVYNVEDKSSE